MSERPKKTERAALAGLLLFGVLAVVLGLQRVGRLIRPLPSDVPAETVTAPTSYEQLAEQNKQALAALDTDKDGLSDLRELEETRTSPFLADSDSDGKSDSDEIAGGEDPNCPAGKEGECAVESAPSASASAEPARVVPDRVGAATRTPAPSLDVSALRLQLSAMGAPPEALNALTDDTLQSMYGSVSGGLRAPQAEPSAGTFLSEALSGALQGRSGNPAALLAALPKEPGAIREYLRQGSFPSDQLAALSDEQLLELWSQVVGDLRKQGRL